MSIKPERINSLLLESLKPKVCDYLVEGKFNEEDHKTLRTSIVRFNLAKGNKEIYFYEITKTKEYFFTSLKNSFETFFKKNDLRILKPLLPTLLLISSLTSLVFFRAFQGDKYRKIKLFLNLAVILQAYILVKKSLPEQTILKVKVCEFKRKEILDITNDINEKGYVCPISAEDISEDLNETQDIYLHNLGVKAQAYLSRLLSSPLIKERDFSLLHPLRNENLEKEENKYVLQQISRIFCISIEKLKECWDVKLLPVDTEHCSAELMYQKPAWYLPGATEQDHLDASVELLMKESFVLTHKRLQKFSSFFNPYVNVLEMDVQVKNND
jgi:hypothetical protein